IVYESAEPKRRIFTHTAVEPEYRGHGIGTALIQEALNDIRDKGLTLTNFCGVVARYIRTHPEYADLIDPAHPGRRTAPPVS
ncbi:MAG TPA: GNAT family N-acetyltransferase, partial [Nitrolancea sp.]|nr:GNAT family N-acetyltransferase [Nitrolancea sp.]